MIMRLSISLLSICLLLNFFFPLATRGHEDASGNVSIVERTGQNVHLDLTFLDEDGHTVTLRQLIIKPTILTPVYYSCNDSCPLMLGALASALGQVRLEPGKDYKVVTISIDKNDTPMIAKQKKGDYIKATGIAFPVTAWRFLTGEAENISRLTEAVGFYYKKASSAGNVWPDSRNEPKGFIHPTVLIFLSPNGKITKYIYFGQSHYASLSRVSFSPVELTSALKDAERGKLRIGSINPIRLCFPGISKQQETFYTILSIVGAITLLCAMVFFIYLRRTGRRSS